MLLSTQRLKPRRNKAYYEVLGLDRGASPAEIKSAYRRESLHYHPDKLRQRGETLTDENADRFRSLKQAYEVLSNPDRRKIYDSLGINGLTLKEEPQSFLSDPGKAQELLSEADKRAYCVIFWSALLGLACTRKFDLSPR